MIGNAAGRQGPAAKGRNDMNAQIACTSAALSLLLAACQTGGTVQPEPAQPYQTLRSFDVKFKSTPTTRAVDCDTARTEDLTARCVVKVKAQWNPGTAKCEVTEVPNVTLKGKNNAIIIWDLPANFRFCPALGDGIFLMEPDDLEDDSFDNFGAPSEGTGNNVFKKCRNRFRVFAENDVGKFKDKPYNYAMQFHYTADPTATRVKYEKDACIADPFIKNGN